MKKRLLSAFLAAAMVLTLIPATMVTAFAVEYTKPITPATPASVTYPTKVNGVDTMVPFYDDSGTSVKTVTVTRCTQTNPTTGQVYGHWYWLDNKNSTTTHRYYEVTSGIVSGTSGSGLWYPDITAYSKTTTTSDGTPTTKVSGAFTVLGSSINLGGYKDTSLTIDFANGVDTLTVPATLTNLTLTAKFTETPGGVADKGHVGMITTARGTYASTEGKTGLTITATNINIVSVDMVGRANTLRLTDCTVGAITMDGKTESNAAGTNFTYNAQTINATRTTTGAITITNGTGGGITLQDSTVNGNVDFTSDSGSISVAGASTVGTITVKPRTETGAYATVKISGGTVGGVTQGTQGTNNKALSVTVTGTNTYFGDIDASINGTVNITDANGKSIIVGSGSLTIGGSNVNVTDDVTMGAKGKTTLYMNAAGSSFGGIKAANGDNVVISTWNGKRQSDGGNDYGVLALGSYDGKKVTGGTFSGAANATNFGANTCLPWLDTANLQFFATVGPNKYALYSKSELARAISDVGNATAIAGNDITVLAQNSGKESIVLMNGNSTLAKIGYNSTTPLILPEKIDNITITTWLAPSNHNVTIPAGTETNVPFIGSDLILNATGTSTAVSKITKASVSAKPSTATSPVVNQNVTVTLNGNNINLSGAVTPNAGGIATVLVDLETDVVQDDGTYLVLEGVIIDYNVTSKKVSFNVIQPEKTTEAGAMVLDGALVLNHGTGERYTVSANLTESASRLGIAPDTTVADSIVVTFGGKLASWSQPQKDELTAKLVGTNASFTYGANQAMQQAINAAQATITNNTTVTNWITTARNTIWRSGYKSPTIAKNTNYGYMPSMAPNAGTYNSNTTSGAAIDAAFGKAYIVPYLVVNVTDYDATAGTMTATLTPYYRVDVSASAGYVPDVFYTVQTGRALTLTGDVTSNIAKDRVVVQFGDELASAFEGKFMHQDGKYVYQAPAGAKEWMISHLGANGTLGTVTINSTSGYVIMADTTVLSSMGINNTPPSIVGRAPSLSALNCTYDTLQAAIDDTVRGASVLNDNSIDSFQSETMDTIVIDGNYTGSCAITMSGMSRNVYVVGNGQQDVTCNTTNVDVQFQGGYRYLIQMKQDNVPAGTVAIGVTGTTAGTASVSASSAKAGQTVTVTVLPNAGQTATGVTIRTNSGATVTATPTGNANEYSFTVPTGATSITVTPVFGAAQVVANALVTVANPSTGSGSAVTSAGNNRVAAGTVVTVTTVPGTNQRTMGIAVNGNSSAATRTGVNTFQFTVPSNVTSVVVTPSFDANNGTVFNDVWSSEYYSPAVAWAVSQGVTDGTSTYTFSPSTVCTRGQMVTFLYRAAGSPAVTSTYNPFVDVAPGTYYYNAVLWAVSKGITDGTSSTTFSPNQTVTRGQAVTFLYRYAGSPTAGTNSGFYDVASSEYYAKPVAWAVSQGITNGTSGSTFSPSAGCTRAQIVTFLYRDINGIRA